MLFLYSAALPAGGDLEARDAGELAADLVGDAVGEVLVLRRAEVLEREHGEPLDAAGVAGRARRGGGASRRARRARAGSRAPRSSDRAADGAGAPARVTARAGRRGDGRRRGRRDGRRRRRSARASSAAAANRSAGTGGERLPDRLVHRLRHVRAAPRARSARGSVSRFTRIACVVAPVNGGSPASISYSTAPRL